MLVRFVGFLRYRSTGPPLSNDQSASRPPSDATLAGRGLDQTADIGSHGHLRLLFPAVSRTICGATSMGSPPNFGEGKRGQLLSSPLSASSFGRTIEDGRVIVQKLRSWSSRNEKAPVFLFFFSAFSRLRFVGLLFLLSIFINKLVILWISLLIYFFDFLQLTRIWIRVSLIQLFPCSCFFPLPLTNDSSVWSISICHVFTYMAVIFGDLCSLRKEFYHRLDLLLLHIRTVESILSLFHKVACFLSIWLESRILYKLELYNSF